MGFLSLDGTLSGKPGPAPVTVGNAQLVTFLSVFEFPSEHELYELRDLLPPHTRILSGSTALIAVFVETETTPITLPPASGEPEDAVSHFLSAKAEWLRASSESSTAPSGQEHHIFFLDWDQQFRLCAVCTRSAMSFSAVPLSALEKGTDENLAMCREIASLLRKGWTEPDAKPPTLHLVLRLRGGLPPEGEPIKGLDINSFLRVARGGDVGDQTTCIAAEMRSEIVERALPGSAMEGLGKRSEPYDSHSNETKSNRVRKTAMGLFKHDALVMGKWFNKVTFQAQGGDFIVSFKSRLRPQRADIQMEGEIGYNAGPSATLKVGTAIRRRENVELNGPEALNKVMTEMRTYKDVRRWFLSCLIRGTILVDEHSPADGFIPEHVQRGKGRGIMLKDTMPVEYFVELGGMIGSVGTSVVFKSYSDDRMREVIGVDADGVLTIGSKYTGRPRRKGEPVMGRNAVYLWEHDSLEVGGKSKEERSDESSDESEG